MHAVPALWGEHCVSHGADPHYWRAAGKRHNPRTAPASAAGRAARNAVDCALWDLQARRVGKTIPQLLGIGLPNRVVTAQTVVIGTLNRWRPAPPRCGRRGRLLKVKLDNHLISERLIAIRNVVPEATLIVDANESWSGDGLAARCQLLADIGVAMLEQPLPADADDALENFIHPLPVCADESCHTRDSLPQLRGRYEMVNIKLDKTGGLTEALFLAQEAGELGFERMLGCMLCTSRAISAALPLAPLARFADLDGPTGWRWMLSRRCISAPECFISEHASAADPSSPTDVFRRFVGRDGRKLGGDAGQADIGAPAAKRAGVS